MRTWHLFGPILLASVLAECAGNDTVSEGAPSSPGVLILTFHAPEIYDGALLFTVSGGPVDSLTAGPLAYHLSSATQPSLTRIVVVGLLGNNGKLAELHVPDITLAPEYVVNIEQVTDYHTLASLPVPGHSVTVAPP